MREAPWQQLPQGWGQGPAGCEAPGAGLTQGSLCQLLGQHNGAAGGHPTPPHPTSTLQHPQNHRVPCSGQSQAQAAPFCLPHYQFFLLPLKPDT